MKYVSLFFVLLFIVACDNSKANRGNDFLGIWESNDEYKVKIEITEQFYQGKRRKDRFEVKLLDTVKLPKYHIQQGQYNYQLVTADQRFNVHPFREFIHKNSFGDTIPYLGFENGKKTLVRKFRGIDGLLYLSFRKVE